MNFAKIKELPLRWLAKAAPPIVDPVVEVAPDNAGIPFLEVKEGLCRWPLWPDQARVSFDAKRVCGCPARYTMRDGKRVLTPYCELHYTAAVYPNHWKRAA